MVLNFSFWHAPPPPRLCIFSIGKFGILFLSRTGRPSSHHQLPFCLKGWVLPMISLTNLKRFLFPQFFDKETKFWVYKTLIETTRQTELQRLFDTLLLILVETLCTCTSLSVLPVATQNISPVSYQPLIITVKITGRGRDGSEREREREVVEPWALWRVLTRQLVNLTTRLWITS